MKLQDKKFAEQLGYVVDDEEKPKKKTKKELNREEAEARRREEREKAEWAVAEAENFIKAFAIFVMEYDCDRLHLWETQLGEAGLYKMGSEVSRLRNLLIAKLTGDADADIVIGLTAPKTNNVLASYTANNNNNNNNNSNSNSRIGGEDIDIEDDDGIL